MAKSPKATSPAPNATPETTEADLRRDFMLAMSDALRSPKLNATMLDVVRRYLADQDAQRRWQGEQSPDEPPAVAPHDPAAVAAALPFSAPTRPTEDNLSGTAEDTRSFASVAPRLADEVLPFQAG